MAAEFGVGVAGVAVSLPGLLDVCIRYVHFLRQRWRDYKEAEKALKQLDMAFQVNLDNVDDALTFMKELGPVIRPETSTQLSDILDVLHNDILKVAHARLEPYTAAASHGLGRWQRATFSSSRKSIFQSLDKELDRWLDKFKNRLYFLTLAPSNFTPYEEILDQKRHLKVLSAVESLRELVLRGQQRRRGDVLISPENVPHGTREALTFSAVEGDEGNGLIVETKFAPPRRSDEAPAPGPLTGTKKSKLLNKIQAADMASILNASEPEVTSILKCVGYYPEGEAHKLVFHYPQGLGRPRTLRDLLISDREVEPRHPLNDRVRLARKVASSVLFVHSAGVVHKNIRPDNIIIFEPADADADRASRFPRRIGLPFLVGFDYAHPAAAVSDRVSDAIWWNDIYRHPQRQGQYPDEMFSMLHDVYSLGVVLLEIALWTPFVLDRSHVSPATGSDTPMSQVSQIRDGEINPDLDGTCNISRRADSRRSLLPPADIVKVFLETAKRQLPRTMGGRYCDVVTKCLMCVDAVPGEVDATASDTDDTIGKLFIENILATLEEIVV